MTTIAMQIDAKSEMAPNKKRQLFSRHGSYVVGSSEARNKDIKQRYVIFGSLKHVDVEKVVK